MECPQQAFPELAGRRLFLLKYSDIDPRDVETIRRELGQALRYTNSHFFWLLLVLLSLFTSTITDKANISTQAWSITQGADGKYKFYPEQTGADKIRQCLQFPILRSRNPTVFANQVPRPSLASQ